MWVILKGWAKLCRTVWLVHFLTVMVVVMRGGGVSALLALLCVFLIGLFELDAFWSVGYVVLGRVPALQCFRTSVTHRIWVSRQENAAASHLPRLRGELLLHDRAVLPSFTSLLWCCEFHSICSWLMWNPDRTGEWWPGAESLQIRFAAIWKLLLCLPLKFCCCEYQLCFE